ncbi:hypothetical protein J7I94_34705 [Streptomyces sp. ISL-12]|uniref:hypothetical protein n=1 Tax=Streptomyces sp. ISL-12 TaxID=2819177 RepID=UPI001BE8667F|nr:hypothetical protein [Streptomyces sp. ISL-12]MBT2415623.1 hypothetical protein [Streptomyces sp. ISL-12]
MTTTPATAPAPAAKDNRKRNRLIIGAATAVIAAALVAGAGYWWQQKDALSQASVADCKLAQRIITEGKQISTGSAADAQKWWERTGDERRAQMKDGYLGAKISNYEGWALATAKKSSEVPSAKDVKDLQEKAQGHCENAGVTLSMPRLGS